MDSRNQEFVDTLLADVLSDRQLAQLALDPGERRDVQQRVVQQAEASTQASVVATEAIRLANQYDVEGESASRSPCGGVQATCPFMDQPRPCRDASHHTMCSPAMHLHAICSTVTAGGTGAVRSAP